VYRVTYRGYVRGRATSQAEFEAVLKGLGISLADLVEDEKNGT
jgi:hypothetical protein